MLTRLSGLIIPFIKSPTFTTLVLRAVGVLLLFGISFILTNNFDSSSVGQYELTRTRILVLGSICLLGFDISIIYFAGRLKALNHFEQIKVLYYRMIKLVVIIAIILLLAYLAGCQILIFISEDSFVKNSLIVHSLICLSFYSLTILNGELLRAIDRTSLSEWFRNVLKYIPFLVGILYLIFSSSLQHLVSVYLYGFVITFLVSQFCVIYYLRKFKKNQSANHFSYNQIVKISFPMGLSSMVMFLLLAIDLFLLEYYFNESMVAYYAIVVKLITLLSIVIISFNINISSQIAELFNRNDMVSLQKLCRKSARFMFLINIVLSFLLIVFIEFILKAYGAEYLYAKNAFYVLVVSQLFTSAFGVVPVYLNMTGRAVLYQSILIGALIFNLIFNLILIPKFDIMGAAVTFTGTVIFWNIIVTIYVYKKDKINISLL